MSRSPFRRIWILLAFSLAVAACAGGSSEGFAYSERPTLIVIDSAAGNVIVDGASLSVDGVEVESDVSNTTITEELVDGVLTITDDCDGNGCGVDYFVQLNGPVTVQVTTETGTISVTGIDGDATLASTTGLITLNGVTGTVSATAEEATIIATRLESALAEFRTGAGDIDVTFDEPVEALIADTGSGDVTAQLPDGAYAFVTSTGDGATDIVLEDDATSDKMVSLTTGAGDITVYRR